MGPGMYIFLLDHVVSPLVTSLRSLVRTTGAGTFSSTYIVPIGGAAERLLLSHIDAILPVSDCRYPGP